MAGAIARGANWAILYDPALVTEPGPALFDPGAWAGRLVGQAPRGRGQLVFVTAGAEQWALRHYRRGGVPGRILQDQFLWLGEAAARSFREWRMLARLHAAGLPVPRPVAAAWRRHGLAYVADLATVRIPDVLPLSARLAEGAAVDWHTIGRTLGEFHAAGACHADLNAHNILLDTGGQAWLIDFDRGRFRPPGRWRRRNLDRLQRSLRKLAGQGDAPRFDSAGWAALEAGYLASRALRRASRP